MLTVAHVNQAITDLDARMQGCAKEFRCASDVYHKVLSAAVVTHSGVAGPLCPGMPVMLDEDMPPGFVRVVRHNAADCLIQLVEEVG